MLCYLVYEKTDKHFMWFTPLDDGNNAFCNEFEDIGTRALLVSGELKMCMNCDDMFCGYADSVFNLLKGHQF